MIITCPACETQYDVPDSALAPAGRTVQCARCQVKWHAGTPPPLAEAENRPDTAKAGSEATGVENPPETDKGAMIIVLEMGF